MGVSLNIIRNLVPLVSGGLLPPRASILEYGLQNIHWSSADQERELTEFVGNMRTYNGLTTTESENDVSRIGSGGLHGDLLRQCGFRYVALDICSGSDGIILFDLNHDKVPVQLFHTFDLVTNFGTTEHIINQYNSFLTMHDFTKPGGIMYHDLPLGGYFFHGYFCYTPLFFSHLALANDYEILYRRYWKGPANHDLELAPAELTEHGWPDTHYQNWGVAVIFRKTSSRPFRMPVEVGTSGQIDEGFAARQGEEMRLISGRRDVLR
jgi:hypothetical protein